MTLPDPAFRDHLITASLKRVFDDVPRFVLDAFRDHLITASLKLLPPDRLSQPNRTFRDHLITASLKPVLGLPFKTPEVHLSVII